jgi:hypothetical protein
MKYEQQTTVNNFFVTKAKYRPEKGPSRLCLVYDILLSGWLLSALFFNSALEYATRMVHESQKKMIVDTN